MLVIRDMTLADCEAVAALDKEAFSKPMSAEGYQREYTNPNSTTLIADLDGSVIGFANIWNICGDVTLNNIAVTASQRSNGAGTVLMREMFVRFAGCDFITLEVRASNEGAIRFYKRFGFRQVGLRRDFYDLPKEDALLMTVYLEDARR
ncbi:MAG: ribosomal protein S18-alanine N-acetyltransferase [Ruminococcus sp.]|nr:ribosomal protein S18-alanine N-acetyltransferase [Ruminococcus sp.]